MKKYLAIIPLLLLFFLPCNHTFSISVAEFTPTLDKRVASMKTTEEKVNYLKSFAEFLQDPIFTQHENARVYNHLREYTLNMLRVFEYELKEEKAAQQSQETTLYSTKSTTIRLPDLSDNFSNIDEQKVRKAILSWHNDERRNVWVNSYTYNLDLEWSATVWANKLANSSKISNLHVRKDGDWTYNYNSILNRFSDLWINFPASVKWAASFSESIWYWYYKCSKSDCTQELIDSIQKTRTWLIMKEKSYNWDHYRAAVMKHFTQMWAWIAIDKSNNRYYIVLHYGVNF